MRCFSLSLSLSLLPWTPLSLLLLLLLSLSSRTSTKPSESSFVLHLAANIMRILPVSHLVLSLLCLLSSPPIDVIDVTTCLEHKFQRHHDQRRSTLGTLVDASAAEQKSSRGDGRRWVGRCEQSTRAASRRRVPLGGALWSNSNTATERRRALFVAPAVGAVHQHRIGKGTNYHYYNTMR